MKPPDITIGRLVFYRRDSKLVPALVCGVTVEGLEEGRPFCDLYVFDPGSPPYWAMRSQEGSGVGNWRWPPR